MITHSIPCGCAAPKTAPAGVARTGQARAGDTLASEASGQRDNFMRAHAGHSPEGGSSACAGLTMPGENVLAHTAHLYQPGTRRPYGVLEWPAMLRRLEAEGKHSGYPPYWQ